MYVSTYLFLAAIMWSNGVVLLYFSTDPPENTTLSSATISVEEGKVPPKIVCSSRAYPEPAFYWTRNGVTIAKGSALIVENVLQRNDAGIYTCTAFNKHGNHSTDAYIDIHCKYPVAHSG